ncbi:hypothetical protein L1049_023339 [Liquidambar formosana]|uniref:FYVE-type domain-containing protein n=1 Tax=Liquidambar formosana TaxID=63359 RepID=A0AAP0X0H6_LIQFO
MQQGDYTTSYYQYYQSDYQNQNPNPNPNPNDIYSNSTPSTHASAPPISSSYTSSNYPSYSSTYPLYSHFPDPVPNTAPTATTYPQNTNSQSPNPSLQPSSFPHLSHFPAAQEAPYYPYDPSNHSYSYAGASTPPNYENPYETSAKFNSGGGYFDENSGHYGTQFDDRGGVRNQVLDGGVYSYEGGKVEPYGARGMGSESSTSLAFDDYGRPISLLSGKEQVGSRPSDDIVKATPKIDTQHDVKSGVRKFRVMLLAETVTQSNVDVLCQIGLDGIRMLDPATSRILKVYPLEMVIRWEVLDSSIFAFWAKSSTDVEPGRIRLRSNSYTTNTILDTVTAATVQLKEMGGRNKPSDFKVSEQLSDKKKGFSDWMNLMKPSNEEKDYWVPDEAVTKCTACGTDFGAFVRKHHCRNCGDIFCDKCTQGRIALTADEEAQPVRVCDRCMAEVTQRLSDAREPAGKIAGFQTHEDLAKKLQEEMDRNRQTSSGFKSDGSVMQMREVACPTCTVHLQVQVPTSGSKTIECSVCQHPFLVNAH